MIENLPASIRMGNGINNDVFTDAMKIRNIVFVNEQGVPKQNELDEWDNTAFHFVAYINDVPVATARVYFFKECAKICRVAVLKKYRRRGFAKKLCEYCVDYIENMGYALVFLHSQTYIKALYESLGFTIEGGEFLEENIPHIKMVKHLTA
jgi:predicted GNAT family N-acyltransferase